MNEYKISSLLLGTFLIPVVSYGSVDFRPASLGTTGFGPVAADFSGSGVQFAGAVVSDAALFGAIKAQNINFVNYLLDHGANVNSRKEEVEYETQYSYMHYLSPLVVAIRTGNIDMVRLLLEWGANVNTKGGNDNVPLYEAVISACDDVVRLLLEQKEINVNAYQNINMSYDQIESLGYAGEPYDYQVPETALEFAKKRNFKKCLALLLTHDAQR
jgi:ankyrin repeat protein